MKSIVTFNGRDSDKFPRYIQQGVFGMDLNFAIIDANDIVVDLTGKTVTLIVKDLQDDSIYLTKVCVATDITTGLFKYTLTSTDFELIGIYEASLTITESTIFKDIIPLGIFGVTGLVR